MSHEHGAVGTDRTPTAWRFGSPSALLLALLMLPLPWLEVRCGRNTHYTQTGLQVLGNRRTDLTTDPPQSDWANRPLRTAVCWWWLLVAVAGVGLGLYGRSFAPRLLNLMLSCISSGLFLLLLSVIYLEEALDRKTFLPAVLVPPIACAFAAVSSTITFVRMNRSPPLVDS